MSQPPRVHAPLRIELSGAAWKQLGSADRQAFQRIIEALQGLSARLQQGPGTPEQRAQEAARLLQVEGLEVGWRIDLARAAISIDHITLRGPGAQD
jgi:hypothetical protein